MICTVLNENTTLRPELEAEHGLSLHIQAGTYHCLFDFGQSDRWLRNAKLLGIDTSTVDFAVLSHGYYDHAGGMLAFLDQAIAPRVFRGKRCWDSRGSLQDGRYHELGIPGRDELRRRLDAEHDLEASFSPYPGVHLLMPEHASFPHDGMNGRTFVVQKDGAYQADEFLDELTMVIEEKGELSIFTACAHRGIFTIIDEVKERFPQKKIAALVGGLHLRDQSESAIRSIAKTLAASGIRHFYPGHCTGERGISIMTELMPHRVFTFRTGSQISLP